MITCARCPCPSRLGRFRAVRNSRPVCTRRAGGRPRFRFSLAMHVIPYELYVHSLPAPTTTLHRDVWALKIARDTNAPARCDLSRYARLLISVHANRVASRRLNVDLTLRNQWNDHQRSSTEIDVPSHDQRYERSRETSFQRLQSAEARRV